MACLHQSSQFSSRRRPIPTYTLTVKEPTILIALVLFVTLGSLGQTSQTPDLAALEGNVAKQFTDLRAKAGMTLLELRRDIRMRMEACSVALNGPDNHVESESQYALAIEKLWYVTDDPTKQNDQLAKMATMRTGYDHVAVGIWFGATKAAPNGTYWVVVMPEHSAAHEGFWSHFYLTDDFEYQKTFSKQ